MDVQEGQEKLVDDALHARIMRLVLKGELDDIALTKNKCKLPQRILVLFSRDAANNSGGTTFPDVVELALKCGWIVEIISKNRSYLAKYSLKPQEYFSKETVQRLGALGLACKFLGVSSVEKETLQSPGKRVGAPQRSNCRWAICIKERILRDYYQCSEAWDKLKSAGTYHGVSDLKKYIESLFVKLFSKIKPTAEDFVKENDGDVPVAMKKLNSGFES